MSNVTRPHIAMEKEPRPLRSNLVIEAAQFIGLSGVGWLLDFVLLLLMVRFFKMPIFRANLISSSTAGLFVFFASRRMVFRSTHGRASSRALFYLVYTISMILLASTSMRLLVGLFHAGSSPWLHRPVIAAALAKVLVTPVSLALNFVVAKSVNDFGKQKLEQL